MENTKRVSYSIDFNVSRTKDGLALSKEAIQDFEQQIIAVFHDALRRAVFVDRIELPRKIGFAGHINIEGI